MSVHPANGPQSPDHPSVRPTTPSRRRLLVLSVPVLLTGAGALAIAADSNASSTTAATATSTEIGESAPGLDELLAEDRSLDGIGNNLGDPDLGAAGSIYRRAAEANYLDGVGEPDAGPPERAVSNRIFNGNNQNVFSENGVTHWGFVWGQFIDHTIGLRETADTEEIAIAFDPADPLEEFTNDLGAIVTDRSAFADGTGVGTPRQQINTISSYIDGWAVYGGSDERLDWLRDGPVDGDPTNNDATLLTADGYLPTADARSAVDAPPTDLMGRLFADPSAAVVAGDVRVNENLGLTAVHTLFVREHNRIVERLPNDLDEQTKFAIARRVVTALQQYVTYQEFLPAMGVVLEAYDGYDPTVDPTITNEFATVGYRAHSQIHGEFEAEIALGELDAGEIARLRAHGVTVEANDEAIEVAIPLNVAFGNPGLLTELGLGNVLQGLSSEAAYANDEQIDNQLRSVLFQIPGPDVENPLDCLDGTEIAGCFTSVNDLGALDVVRGYDHGMPTYNEMRIAFGLSPVGSFTELTGESTEELPAGLTIDDPAIMDFVTLLDGDGNELEPGSDAADGDTVTAIRRSTTAARLKALFGDVGDVDAFTGMVSEPHVAGTEFGELQLAMWTQQFQALRDGDRFYYENDPALDQIAETYGIDYRRSLGDVIAANTGVDADDLPASVFRLDQGQSADADETPSSSAADSIEAQSIDADSTDGGRGDDDRARRRPDRAEGDRRDRPRRRSPRR